MLNRLFDEHNGMDVYNFIHTFFALLYILPYKNAFPSDTNNQYGTEGGRI